MGRRRLAALAALALLLGACDDAEPRVADPTSTPPTSEPTTSSPTTPEPTSPSPSSSPSPSEPPTTEPPKRESAQTAIRAWQSASNAMQSDGDTSAFRDLSSKCRSCEEFADRVDQIYSDGGFIRTSGSKILSIKRWGTIRGWPTFDVRVMSSPTRFKESAEADIDSYPGGHQTLRVSLARQGEAWVVRKYGVVLS